MAVKACYTADGRVPFDGVDFLAPGTLRLLSSSLQFFERVEEDAMVYLAAPEPNRRTGGEVRCGIESEQCAGDTRWRGFEVGLEARGLVERTQERTG